MALPVTRPTTSANDCAGSRRERGERLPPGSCLPRSSALAIKAPLSSLDAERRGPGMRGPLHRQHPGHRCVEVVRCSSSPLITLMLRSACGSPFLRSCVSPFHKPGQTMKRKFHLFPQKKFFFEYLWESGSLVLGVVLNARDTE